MEPLRGWAPKGQRLRAKVPFGHWKTMTFLAALRHDRIVAPWVFDGPINGQSFQVYVRQVLIPTLSTDDIVVLDNLSSHKSKQVRKAVRAAGAHLLFLPPYSPDLNPIEQVFAKLKHLLRKAAKRTAEPHGGISVNFLTNSHPTNAPTTSPTQDTLQCRVIPL